MDGISRFSLLLLEPGEIYFEDFAAIYILPNESTENDDGWENKFEDGMLRGRLKVCSKSLVFDSRDIRAPIIKFPYRSFEAIDEGKTTRTNELLYSEGEQSIIELTCSMTVEMLEGGVLQPYKFCREEHSHLFQLIYAEVSEVLPKICQLHRASTLPPNDQNTMIQAIVRSRQSRQKFDRALLGDLSETEVFETKANKVTPLVTNPGTVLLTTSMLYFQPHNNAEKYPVIRIGLSEIQQVIKRRYLLRQVGLEVFCRDQCMVKHLLLTFKESGEREKLYDLLIQLEKVNMDDMRQDNMSYQWQAGAISNYDYLCYLNSQADRSENDLTQYPVFPWVLADYVSETLDLTDHGIYRDLSKPIGALNEERLKRLKDRCKDMPEPRFLYGSHYSTPGFVLFYLVRQYPQYMLCLQNGRFDHPDRMFNSLPETWCNVTTNPSDFKELIPNFYNLDGSADFLTNSLRINFGVRQNGKPVGEVELPPWAKDPLSVIKIMREALESEYVSNHLHLWIDLIFGYKQNGEEAEKSDNLFYHLCYEGSVDLGAITDLNDRLALEVQITEFGQVPKQLFGRPHPRRSRSYGLYDSTHLTDGMAEDPDDFMENSIESAEKCLGRSSSTVPSLWQRLTDLQRLGECRAHREVILGVAFTADAQQIISVGQDSLIKMYAVPGLDQMRSVRVSSMAASCCLHLPSTDMVLVGSWDNNVYTYNLEYSQVCMLLEAHSDAVSCMQWKNNILVTGSWDCTTRVWSVDDGMSDDARNGDKARGRGSTQSSLSAGQNIICEMDHDSPVSCVALHPEGSLLATGTQDGVLSLWLLPAGDLMNQLNCHKRGMNVAVWSTVDDRILTGGNDGLLTIVDAHQGTKICVHNLEEVVRCVAWEGRLVIAGGVSGNVILFDMGTGLVIKRFSAHNGPVTCLALSPNNSHFVTGSEDRRIMLWGVNS